MKFNSIKRFGFVVSVISTFNLFGCSVVTTSIAPNSDSTIEGMVYHLPSSYLKVGIESKKDDKGNHSELVVATSPEIVPDKNARLKLKTSNNGLFTQNHTFTFTNGLLSTVVTDDEGKSGEIVSSLATVGINIIKFAALPSTPKGLEVTREFESWTPTNEEITAALASIAPGRQEFLFRLTRKSAKIDLPGTAKLVVLSTEIPELPEAPQTTISADTFKEYEGIATRILEPYQVNIVVDLNLAVLYANRIDSLAQKIDDLKKTIGKTTKDVDDLKQKLTKLPTGSAEAVDLKGKIATTEKTLNDSKKGCDEATRRREKNEVFLEGPHANEVYKIANQSALILIPNFSPTVKIPLKCAPLGKTKLTLTLDHGILTDYHEEYPSTSLEIVKIPLNITEAIIKLPAEIIQLKIDYSSKAQALIEAQNKYQETLKGIADKKNGPSSYDEQVKALEQEKAILQLQKEITELKSAISKL